MSSIPTIPPVFLDDSFPGLYVPDPKLWGWCVDNLLNESSELFNPDHMHLADAMIGFIWTNQENASKGRQIIGQAEQPIFRAGKWQKGRQEQQIMEWFGCMPNFLITLDVNYCIACPDTDFLMLLEHELFHCAQAIDDYGMPKFSQETGEPSFTIKGHDVEEFIGVVERYGIGGPEGNLAKLVHAANKAPSIGAASIAKCCGTCLT